MAKTRTAKAGKAKEKFVSGKIGKAAPLPRKSSVDSDSPTWESKKVKRRTYYYGPSDNHIEFKKLKRIIRNASSLEGARALAKSRFKAKHHCVIERFLEAAFDDNARLSSSSRPSSSRSDYRNPHEDSVILHSVTFDAEKQVPREPFYKEKVGQVKFLAFTPQGWKAYSVSLLREGKNHNIHFSSFVDEIGKKLVLHHFPEGEEVRPEIPSLRIVTDLLRSMVSKSIGEKISYSYCLPRIKDLY
jgi:hypothetical protein